MFDFTIEERAAFCSSNDLKPGDWFAFDDASGVGFVMSNGDVALFGSSGSQCFVTKNLVSGKGRLRRVALTGLRVRVTS